MAMKPNGNLRCSTLGVCVCDIISQKSVHTQYDDRVTDGAGKAEIENKPRSKTTSTCMRIRKNPIG